MTRNAPAAGCRRTNSHPRKYKIARERFAVPGGGESDDGPPLEERRVRLKAVIDSDIRRFIYCYDFGELEEGGHSELATDLVALKPVAPLLASAGAKPRVLRRAPAAQQGTLSMDDGH